MKHLLSLIHIILIASLFGCEQSDEPLASVEPMPLVVEGWIQEGRAPVVMVTRAVDLTIDHPTFDSIVDTWCRVTIYDNDRPYVLTLRRNEAYLTKMTFTSTRLKGTVGHTYRLVVESDDRKLTATSTMTPAPKIDSLRAVPQPDNDSLFTITAYTGSLEPGSYHKYYLKTIGVDDRSYPAFLGNVSADFYDSSKGTSLALGKRAVLSDSVSTEVSHYFRRGQTVLVECVSMDRTIYDFWRTYDANVSFSQNIFFNFSGNLPTNIEGGLGYFAAYGLSEQAIRIR